MNKKIFELTYQRASGGFQQRCTEYYSAECIQDVYLQIMSEYKNKTHEELLKDQVIVTDLNSNNERIVREGEWYDEILSGGDWMYFDLCIVEVNPYEVIWTAALSQGQLFSIDDITELRDKFIKAAIYETKPVWLKFKENI